MDINSDFVWETSSSAERKTVNLDSVVQLHGFPPAQLAQGTKCKAEHFFYKKIHPPRPQDNAC